MRADFPTLAIVLSIGLNFTLIECCTAFQTAQASEEKEQSVKPDIQAYWIFLTTGTGSEKYSNEEIQEMQKKHLANFKRLADKDELLVAGPLNDPNKKMRGIVIVLAKDKADLPEMFKPDPYVTNGLMKVDAAAMKLLHGRFHKVEIAQGFDELPLVIFKRKPEKKLSDKLNKEQNDYLDKLKADGKLRFAGQMLESKAPWQQILILEKATEEQARTIVERAPYSKSGSAQSTIITLYTIKNAITAK